MNEDSLHSILTPMKRVCRMVLEEPYRVFFPLGVLAAIWGVMMWPMFYAGWLRFYPNEAHARMMIEGFMGAFVMGFIGTAFPRLTGNRSWWAGEFFVLAGMWLMMVTSHASGHVATGDSLFAAMLLLLFIGMVGRWALGNRDTPPPGFILALTDILGAIMASAFLAWSKTPALAQWQSARLLLFQGFPLLPLMGIGPYVMPRFFGTGSSHSFDDSPRPPAGWWKKASASAMAGLLVIVSFALEVSGKPLAGHLLRAAVILVWFALETPVFRRAKISTTPANAVRWALLGLVSGCVCAGVWPLARLGSMHLFFASGIGLVTLAVGARVILGHAGRHDLLAGKIVWLRWVVGLLVLAATTRMSADFIPAVRVSHHIYAAWTWAIGGILWLAALAKFLFRNEDSAKPKSNCPRKKGSG